MPYSISESNIKNELIEEYHQYLMKHKTLQDVYIQKRGYTIETLKRFKIGFHSKLQRYTIPVQSALGQWLDIRLWKANSKKGEPKILSYWEGEGKDKKTYGGNRLFPQQCIARGFKSVVICEGEGDAILLNQYGITAVTSTCGVSAWDEDWNDFFKDKNVAIIFDCQDVSRKAAIDCVNRLTDVAAQIKNIDLGLSDKEDITDWFVKYHHTDKELLALVGKTPPIDFYETISLSDSMKAKYYDKKIRFHSVVIGKDLAPYLVPLKVTAECKGIRGKERCVFCPLVNKKPLKYEYTYNENKYDLIKMINSSDDQLVGIIRKSLSLPPSSVCRDMNLKITDRQNIEVLSLMPELDRENIDKEYVVRKAYFFGIDIQANHTYLCKGTTCADPTSQQGLHIVKEAKGSTDCISRFHMTKEIIDNLKIFQPKDQSNEQAISEKLNEIHEDLTYNVTKMYERKNIIMATELVYHSVLQFNFLDEVLYKGWLEMACIGDTRAGKSKTVQRLASHYRAGEFITSGENTTRAGLLGGGQQLQNGRWTITWGKIPLNDRGLVTIDEADNLTENGIIGLLSGVRSTGIAELMIINPQKTNARTRIIWIANPLHGRMAEHNYGVESIKELFVKQQDISRIDFAICVSEEDVPAHIINQRQDKQIKHIFTSDACHDRVMWAWNRKPEHIIWKDNAEDLILNIAQELGERYSSEIPIVIGAEQRIKLAKMAVAMAAMLFSTDDGGEKVIVYPAHVSVVAKWLKSQYDNPVMGYKTFSDQRKRESTLNIADSLSSLVRDEETINMLLDTDRFQLSDFEIVLGIDRQELKKAIGILRKARAIKRVHTFYKKTSPFIEWLKKQKMKIQNDHRVNIVKNMLGGEVL